MAQKTTSTHPDTPSPLMLAQRTRHPNPLPELIRKPDGTFPSGEEIAAAQRQQSLIKCGRKGDAPSVHETDSDMGAWVGEYDPDKPLQKAAESIKREDQIAMQRFRDPTGSQRTVDTRARKCWCEECEYCRVEDMKEDIAFRQKLVERHGSKGARMFDNTPAVDKPMPTRRPHRSSQRITTDPALTARLMVKPGSSKTLTHAKNSKSKSSRTGTLSHTLIRPRSPTFGVCFIPPDEVPNPVPSGTMVWGCCYCGQNNPKQYGMCIVCEHGYCGREPDPDEGMQKPTKQPAEPERPIGGCRAWITRKTFWFEMFDDDEVPPDDDEESEDGGEESEDNGEISKDNGEAFEGNVEVSKDHDGEVSKDHGEVCEGKEFGSNGEISKNIGEASKSIDEMSKDHDGEVSRDHGEVCEDHGEVFADSGTTL